jgi:hypothetical protein
VTPRDPERAIEELRRDGVVVLGQLLDAQTLEAAQARFAQAASSMTFNERAGYFAADPYRRMVPDVLRLARGFVELATHPLVLEVCRAYLGAEFIVTEAKGWRSNPTQHDFHGWHNDAWYDATKLAAPPPQLKLGVYLTDVDSGAFQYLRGTHGALPPTHWSNDQADGNPRVDLRGPAGTVFLFDSSGVHRQETPILSARDACFFVFHDPTLPLQDEDLAAQRYHPLLLNAALLGGLDEEQRRALGFGNPALDLYSAPPPARAPALARGVERLTAAHMALSRGLERVRRRAARGLR